MIGLWAPKIRESLRDPRFLVGLALRLGMAFLLQPVIRTEWFIPFLETALHCPLDPWTAHLQAGGSLWAFPYGPVMAAVLAPLTGLGLGIERLFGVAGIAPAGFGLTIVFLDLLVLECLLRLFPDRARQVLYMYWLSPIALFVSFWHGQVDIVPLVFLLWSLERIRRTRAIGAGVLLGAGIAAKLTVLLAVPFFLIYLVGNRRLRFLLLPFGVALLATACGLGLPYLLSPGVREMVLGSPELDKVYALAVDLGGGLRIFLLPVVYALVVYVAWWIRQTTFELLTVLLGVAFFLVVLMTPASPGWFLWVVPFMALVRWERQTSLVLIATFSGLYLLHHLLQASGSEVLVLGSDLGGFMSELGQAIPPHLHSLLLSLLLAAGLILAISMAREGISRNAFFRLSRRPLVIGVAGDSGSGKDTLVEGLTGLFGEHSLEHVSGDDYHHWDRHRPMWTVMTHLNPSANDLDRFVSDVSALADGTVVVTPRYDHASGRFGVPRRLSPRPVLVASGLHVLYAPVLRERCDVRIFLEMDEGLRRRLKRHRDVTERNHDPGELEETLERRSQDAQRFIVPQRDLADLVFSLRPASPEGSSPLVLQVTLRRVLYHEALVRLLIGVCGLRVDVSTEEPSQDVLLTLEGDVTAEDMALAARRLFPGAEELLDLVPRWRDGTKGLMQLITLAQVVHSLRGRLS